MVAKDITKFTLFTIVFKLRRHFYSFYLFIFLNCTRQHVDGTFIPQPGVEPVSPAVAESWPLDHQGSSHVHYFLNV